MEVGALLADASPGLGASAQLDLALRQVEWGQAAGMRYFMLAQHWSYGDVTCLQPVPLAGRLAAELDPASRLGTSVMVAPAYHPIALAEEAATLDLLTAGRFVLGLGNGYRDYEMKLFGLDPADRASRLEEILELLPRLWQEDTVSHAGRHWQFEGFQRHIPTASLGGPPLWVGAKSLVGVRRAARLADGWVAPSKIPFERLEEMANVFTAARRDAGRPPGTVAMLRQIVPGASTDDALDRHHRMSKLRLDEYEKRDLDLGPGNAAGETKDARRTALLGTVDSIVERGQWLAHHCRAEVLVTRVAWLGLSSAEIEEEYARLEEAVAALRAVAPVIAAPVSAGPTGCAGARGTPRSPMAPAPSPRRSA